MTKLGSEKIQKAQRALAGLDPLFFKGIANSKAQDRKLITLLSLRNSREFLRGDHWLIARWQSLTSLQQVCALSLLAIEQDHLITCDPRKIKDGEKKWRAFLDCLEHTEDFYADIGGIIGYHAKVIDLLCHPPAKRSERFLPPPKSDCSQRGHSVERAIKTALAMWGGTALIIPAGGAGDRLNLLKSNGSPLPAAFLTLDGKTLLESIIRDVSGCEYAVCKATGKRVLTPIAIMTSHEKDNHALIEQFLKEQNWFGRPEESFRLFCQPSVPMITTEGTWVAGEPLQLLTKPGGHGVLWRLAQRSGIFDWLHRSGCQKAIVRQINNCLAGSDSGLLTLAGLGWQSGKPMGFVSCPRSKGKAEGVNAVVERKMPGGFTYALENIEYNELPPDFDDHLRSDDSYLANVNLLFVDLKTVQSLSIARPLPGLTINFKTRLEKDGGGEEILAGRLESTMQNISCYLVTEQAKALKEIRADQLQTFAIFCERNKILSAAKRAPGPSAVAETPEMAYLDLQRNHFSLLKSCGFWLPAWKKGAPPAIIALHPALGPDWQIIAQKIRGGSIERASELRLEIAEIDCSNLQLRGSFQIICEAGTPTKREKAEQVPPLPLLGRCFLRNVKVENAGLRVRSNSDYWSQPPQTSESLRVVLHGRSEFCAEDVVLSGARTLHVPSGCKMVARQRGNRVVFQVIPLGDREWSWDYRFEDVHCQLHRLERNIKDREPSHDSCSEPCGATALGNQGHCRGDNFR